MRPALILLAILSAACSNNLQEQKPDPVSPKDGLRLVVVSPSAAEMLAELGMLERIVGIGDFVSRPPGLNRLPRVGPYNAPNIEKVLDLRADILVTVRSEAARASNARLRDLGVEVLELDTSHWEGTRQALRTLGDRLDLGESAGEILASLDEAMTTIRQRAEGSPSPKVLFVVGRDPLYVAGPGSHIDAMIQTAGGTNIAADSDSPYQLVSLETMLQRLPEVIIDTSDNGPDALRGRLPGPWDTWDFLPAVRENRVFWIDPDLLVIPGIRLPAMTERMGRLIHPEIFGDPVEADFEPSPEPGPTETTIEDSP
ncbi:MAG: ABC transporter substrate-binding protein [Acidobacteria bacterium]|uniref:ABC transporter substrate-binding protein n=1 Tax=Candidatus Polarisedimenticola svalbardensis TaxID=2886004 RepID=A0A8J6Y6Y5_9BACT|nr:ABC transporter substrate-binding protein [Candidatus Polarisedimenticola svalbardensis]